MFRNPSQQVISRFCTLAAGVILMTPYAAVALEKPGEEPKDSPSRGMERRADKDGRGKRHDDGDDRRRRGSKFKALDTNSDGFLSFEEFSASERLTRLDEEKRRILFDFLDRNKDGKVEEKELKPRDHGGVSEMHKHFEHLDTNKDGSLDMAEFSRAKELRGKDGEYRAKIFRRMDKNKDGVIQRSELKGSGRMRSRPDLDFSKYDTNNSGGLDYAEFSKLPFVDRLPDDRRRVHFDRIDANNDGEISKDETRMAHKRYPRHRHKKEEMPPEGPPPPPPHEAPPERDR